MTKFKTLRSVIAVLVTMSIFMTYLPFNRVLLADPDDQAQEEEQAQEQTEGQEPEQGTEQLPEQEEETPAEVVEVPTYNDPEPSGSGAAVYYIYEDNTIRSARSGEGNCIGVFVNGDDDINTVEYTAVITDRVFIANNATIVATDKSYSSDTEISLLGDSQLTLSDVVLSSENDYLFSDSEVTYGNVYDYINTINDLSDTYTATVTGEIEITHPTTFVDLNIENGGKLSISYSGTDDGHTTLFLEGLNLSDGTLEIKANDNEQPNCIRIADDGDITVAPTGTTFTAAENSCLELGEDVLVAGLALYQADGTTSFGTPVDEPTCFVFKNNKWILDEGGDTIPTYAPVNNVYFLFVKTTADFDDLDSSDFIIRDTNAAVDGYFPFALIVDDLNDFRANDYKDFLGTRGTLIANNSNVVIENNKAMLNLDYHLAGSTLTFTSNTDTGSLIISSTNGYFTGDFSDANINNVFNFLMSISEDSFGRENYQCSVMFGNFTVDPSTDDDYWLSVKKLTVKNNSTFTFAGNIDADEISIEAGSTLALHEAYWDDTANRYVMYSVAAKDVTINGTFNIQNDNELIIRGDGSLSVGTNESIVTGETPSIIFEKGITSVTGIVLYDDVGSEINPFPNTRSIKFTYYDNKWSFDEILYDYEIETWFFDGFFDKVEFALDNGAFSEAAYRNGLDVSDIEGKTEVVFKPTLADPSWGISVAHYSTNDGETWKPLTPNAQAGTYSMLLSEFTDSCRRVIVEIKSFGPQDGINFYGDLWRLSSIKYQLNGTGDLHDLDFHLAPEAYANANSITFTLTPKEGETLRRVTIGEGNDQVEVQLTNNSFTLTKDNEWAAVYNFDLEFEDGEPTPGPTADYEVDLRYPEDPADFNSITYWIDNGDPRDVDFNNHQHSIGFSNDDISQHDYLYFSAAPKDPSRTIVVRYIVPPANVDPKDWNWTTAQYDETALGYKIPLALFVDGVKTIAVDIYTDNAPGPQPTDPDYSFDVQYTSDLATGFSYKIDDGNWNYTGDNNHRLGLYNSDVTGHLTLYFQPNIVGDKSIKAQYGIPVWVENPDEPDGGHYEVQDWTDVYANTDGSFAFPLNRLSAQNNNFRIDFVEDSGDQPQPTGPSFSIVATGNNGGRITMSPAISVIHEDDEPDVYMYNCSDFNETNVEINADQGYYINRITVKINNGTPVELTNFDPYRYNYKPSERPEENDRIEINVLFATSDGKMVEDVIDHGYAYHDDTEDVTTKIANLEEYLASEIYFRYFREGMYSIAFANEDALKAALTAPESISNADDAVGLPYAAFTFDYNDIHETFKVYLLNGKHDFLVKVVYKNNNVEYLTIENAAWGSADHAYLVDDGIAYIQLFGNGVDSPGAFNIENSEIQASQGTQETSGFDYVVWEDNLEDKTRYTEPFVGEDGQQIGLINTRVILISKTQTNAALRVIGPEDCPGWAYGYIDTVTADSDRSKAKTDYIFMANRSVTIEDVQYMNTSSEPRITNVSIDSHYGLSSDSITVEKTKKEGAVVSYSFEVTFNTAYDMIHLALEYSDGITRYITLHRIAVMVDPSAVNLDNNNQITIEHGTSIWDWRHPYLNGDDYTFDHNDGNIAISATYYYSTGRTAPTSSDKVVLFVTIRKVDGTTETRSIRTPVKDDGTDRTRDDDLSNVYFDDFIVWAGPETEYHNIASVEIFAYNEGDGTVFGGVKAGSEHGYVWINDRDH